MRTDYQKLMTLLRNRHRQEQFSEAEIDSIAARMQNGATWDDAMYILGKDRRRDNSQFASRPNSQVVS